MRVDWLILCRHVEVNNGLVTIVGGGLDIFTVSSFPMEMTVTAAMRIVGLPDQQQHTLEVRVLDPLMAPAGQPIAPVSFGMAPGPNHPVGWETHVLAPLVATFPADQPGTYTLEVSVDGAGTSLSFQVITAAVPPGTP